MQFIVEKKIENLIKQLMKISNFTKVGPTNCRFSSFCQLHSLVSHKWRSCTYLYLGGMLKAYNSNKNETFSSNSQIIPSAQYSCASPILPLEATTYHLHTVCNYRNKWPYLTINTIFLHTEINDRPSAFGKMTSQAL